MYLLLLCAAAAVFFFSVSLLFAPRFSTLSSVSLIRSTLLGTSLLMADDKTLPLLVKALLLLILSVALEFCGVLFSVYFFLACNLTNRFSLPLYGRYVTYNLRINPNFN